MIKQGMPQRRGEESGRSDASAHDALPKALALHGAGGGAWEWSCWARAWAAAGGQFESADFSLHAGEPSCRFQSLVESLQQRHADCRDAVLIGASFGALLACALAPVLVARAVVLLNPLVPAPFLRTHRQTLAKPPEGCVRPWGLAADLRRTRAAVPELREVDALLAFRRWTDFSGDLLLEAQAGVALPRPKCPVLVLQTDEDRTVDVGAVDSLVSEWGTSYLRLPGSHVSPLMGLGWAKAFTAVRAWIPNSG